MNTQIHRILLSHCRASMSTLESAILCQHEDDCKLLCNKFLYGYKAGIAVSGLYAKLTGFLEVLKGII